MANSLYVVSANAADRLALQTALAGLDDTSLLSFQSSEALLAQAATLASGVVVADVANPAALLTGLAAAGRFSTVIVIAAGAIGTASQAMRQGAVDFIEKPFSTAHLTELVEAALADVEGVSADRVAIAQAAIARLTERETVALKGLLEGQTSKVIAAALQVSPRTVEIYRANILEKLGVTSLADALRIAIPGGLFA